ncbi:MAG: TM2 domain-containing protein [Prevotellaceae bacterium]|nr:TM2 domain-containing protein [Prevotellaceae bacterium]
MVKERVDAFLLTTEECFSPTDISMIRMRMESAADEKWALLEKIDFRSPQTALMLSIFGGPIGVDRFYIGDTLLGLIKTITCGGLFVWAFVDQFLIIKATRERNLRLLMEVLNCHFIS